MITKEALINLLKDMELTDVLTIYYDGFIGKGINGVQSKDISLSNNFPNVVERISRSNGEEEKTELLNYWLEDGYVKAKYSYYTKGKYDDYFRRIRTYFIIVPYERISSMKISTTNKK